MYSFDFIPSDTENFNFVSVGKETDEIFMDDLINLFEQFCLGLTFSRETIAQGFVDWLLESEYVEDDD